MMTNELPPMWALDAAAKAAGRGGWDASDNPYHSQRLVKSIVAHARTLAKYERPPVDEAELKRRQDAREAAAVVYARAGVSCDGLEETRRGDDDAEGCVQSAYHALCHRDNVTPVPVEEWGK